MTATYIGKAQSRVEGAAKVTGKARYAADYNVAGLAYGCIVSSAIAKGRIVSIDSTEARKFPGVLEIFTHENNPLAGRATIDYGDEVAPPGSPFRPLHDDQIRFACQPMALVVAESFETARYAASLVRVEYESRQHSTDLYAGFQKAYVPEPREGIRPPSEPRNDAGKALAGAAFWIDEQYRTPAEHHNPMELFATTAVPGENGRMTVYDKTQGVQNVRNYLCTVFGYTEDEVRVVSPFMGGGFGAGLRPQYQVFFAVLAARRLNRPVRVTMTRRQMFSFTRRPAAWQRIALGADSEGRLEAVIHEAVTETSRFEDYSEPIVQWSGMLYRCENVKLGHKVVKLDVNTPGDMRAPGAVWGLYGLECAMDELAAKIGIDPIELRVKNYAETDANDGKPFSSKELRACYQLGAQKFGWARRPPEPRSMREGNTLVGWGMAGGVWDAFHMSAGAKAVLSEKGVLTVQSAMSDIGTGTYTIMTQIAAETLGLPIEKVTMQLADSTFPKSPVEGGSWTAATIGSAVKGVCEKVREKLLDSVRRAEKSPFADAFPEEIIFADGYIRSARDPSIEVSIVDGMRIAGTGAIEEEITVGPSPIEKEYSRRTHSAVFAEVKVDPDLGSIRVARVVSAVAAGRILNPGTAHSQVMGAIVMGIGTALKEESVIDQVLGRFMTSTLADYHVPVNADVHGIEVIFVPEHDEIVNPLGVKGIGEIGITGVAAAIANGVYHATGKRIRDLPITLDKLL